MGKPGTRLLLSRNTGRHCSYSHLHPVRGSIGVPYSVGVGSVVKVLNENRVRVLLSFKDSRTRVGERRPSTSFAKEFVEAFRRANK